MLRRWLRVRVACFFTGHFGILAKPAFCLGLAGDTREVSQVSTLFSGTRHPLPAYPPACLGNPEVHPASVPPLRPRGIACSGDTTLHTCAILARLCSAFCSRPATEVCTHVHCSRFGVLVLSCAHSRVLSLQSAAFYPGESLYMDMHPPVHASDHDCHTLFRHPTSPVGLSPARLGNPEIDPSERPPKEAKKKKGEKGQEAIAHCVTKPKKKKTKKKKPRFACCVSPVIYARQGPNETIAALVGTSAQRKADTYHSLQAPSQAILAFRCYGILLKPCR